MENIALFLFISLLNFICSISINNNLKEMNFIIMAIALGATLINIIKYKNNKK